MAASKEVILAEVRQSVLDAARRLAGLGAEYQKTSWLLEDALEYLAEAEQGDFPEVSIAEILELEAELIADVDQRKVVNG